MKILDFLSMFNRICKRFAKAIVIIIYVALFIILVTFFFTHYSCSSTRLTLEEAYLRGAEDISRDFDKQFNRVLGIEDSIHLLGFKAWTHLNMTERLSR